MDSRIEALSQCTVMDPEGTERRFASYLGQQPLLLVAIRHFG